MRLPIRCLSIAACIAGLSTAALAEQVDNPVYQSWAKYKPGTTATYKQETTIGGPAAAGGAHEMTVTQKLTDVKPDAVTIDVTATMSMQGMNHALPTRTMTIPAKIEKDQVGVPQQMGPNSEKPEVKDMKEGKETIDVNGKQTETTTRQFTVVLPDHNIAMHVKTWFTKDIPGGVVKSENSGEGPVQVHSTMTLADYHVEK